MKEIFKPIPDYPNYEASNLGRIKSKKRNIDVILKPIINKRGYVTTCLSKKGKVKVHYVHKLVAMLFLNHIPNGMKEVIDHIDCDKKNNLVTNLRVVSQRFNTSRHKGKSSKYTGVCWHKTKKKWYSAIWINDKQKHLGSFENEYDAHLRYEQELKKL